MLWPFWKLVKPVHSSDGTTLDAAAGAAENQPALPSSNETAVDRSIRVHTIPTSLYRRSSSLIAQPGKRRKHTTGIILAVKKACSSNHLLQSCRPMLAETPQNPLYERYASTEMARIFSARHRFAQWRRLWIALAECERELGLPITGEQIEQLARAAPAIDLERVAEIERRTRHDVVAHLRHFAEQAGEAGGILHLGATSAFITDNTDLVLLREALQLLARRLAGAAAALAAFRR